MSTWAKIGALKFPVLLRRYPSQMPAKKVYRSWKIRKEPEMLSQFWMCQSEKVTDEKMISDCRGLVKVNSFSLKRLRKRVQAQPRKRSSSLKGIQTTNHKRSLAGFGLEIIMRFLTTKPKTIEMATGTTKLGQSDFSAEKSPERWRDRLGKEKKRKPAKLTNSPIFIQSGLG